MFTDIHTHLRKNSLKKKCIINFFPFELDKDTLCQEAYFSIGLHPKYISNKKLTSYLEKTEKLSILDNAVAIGEIGLDRYYPNFNLQEEVFEKLLILAEKQDLPVIIHCVKAYSEIIHFRKKYNKTPWIIHGFRGKKELCFQLINHDIYISFGAALQNPATSLIETVKDIPLDKVLFETDETKVDIKDIYKAFADIKNIFLNELELKVSKTTKYIFGEKITKY
jgi:TatD DNase family protein